MPVSVNSARRRTRTTLARRWFEPLESRVLLSATAQTAQTSWTTADALYVRPADNDGPTIEASVKTNAKKERIEMADWVVAKMTQPKVRTRTRVPVEEAGVLPKAESTKLLTQSVTPAALSIAAAPAPSATIEAINFNTNATLGGYYFIPPDNSAAAGPGHVVNVVNCAVEWYTKAGVQQNSQRLGKNTTTATGSFFQSLNPVNSLFDPKVIFDPYNNRFVVVALEQTDTAYGDATNTSRILLAVSKTADPNAGWWFTAINSRITVQGKARWCDYPAVAAGTDALYITGNLFGFGTNGTFGGSRLWIVPKSTFYAGAAPTVTVYNPSSSAGLNGNNFTMQPTLMYGTPQSAGAMFLVSTGWVSGSNEVLSVIRIANPLTTPTFTNTFVNVGNIDDGTTSLAAPQLGTSVKLDGGDRRMYHAVWRDNAIYAVSTLSPVSGTNASSATAHWYKLNASSLSSIVLSDQGDIGGEELGANTWTYYPSVAVNTAGDMAVNFSYSSASLYGGAAYTLRLAGDPAGTTQAPTVYAAGQDYYVRTFGTPGVDKNRWGDYSGLSIDPSDGSTFWAYNQYALPRGTTFGGEDGRWGTRYATFSVATPLASISGMIFRDDNGNGTREAGETVGIGGVTVYADANGNATFDAGEASAVTAGDGTYSISLPGGTYTIRQVIPAGYVATSTAAPTVVAAGASATGVDRGDFPTVFGTSGADTFFAQLDATGTFVQISESSTPLPTPTYQIARAKLTTLTFGLGAGDDLLVLGFANGSMLPSGGLTLMGGDGTDEIRLVGASQEATTLSLNDTQGSAGPTITAPLWTYSAMETLTLAQATLNYSGTFSTLSAININAGATLNWM